MMKLQRFLSYFARVGAADEEAAYETEIRFVLDDSEKTLQIHSLRFDVETNQWVITLRSMP